MLAYQIYELINDYLERQCRLLAAYDLGASTGVIQKIHDMHAKYQRPIYIEEKDADIVITAGNWTDYLGKQE